MVGFKRTLALTCLLPTLALLAWGCGPGGLPFERGQAHGLIVAPGSQIHPHLEGNRLVWFDLEGDPNGACHVPSSGPNIDGTCIGVVKGLDLLTGRIRILSTPIYEEIRPRVSTGRVVWPCRELGQQGLCVTPFSHQAVVFYPDVGWSRTYYPDDLRRSAVGYGYLVWAEYTSQTWDSYYRLAWADISDGKDHHLMALDQLPAEVTAYGDVVAWTDSVWTEEGYRYRLEAMDVKTGARTVVRQGTRAAFGLGGAGDVLAWEEYGPDGRVHVFARGPGGAVTRVESEEAQVSTEARLAVSGRRVIWMDHREGDYRIAVADLLEHSEEFVTPEEAVVGVHAEPTASDEVLIWADMRSGDFDLYVYRF